MRSLFTTARLIVTTVLLSHSWVFYAQTDELNLEKYWRLRSRFVEHFIKIGPDPGESLPAGALSPATCIDNTYTDGTNYAITDYGTMFWGDGIIWQGHYIGFLATEYALRKRHNLDVTGVLHELYFALNAVNRLDKSAEPSLDNVYGIPGFYDPPYATLNGFFLREDVGEDFALEWSDEEINMGCVNSANYINNNVAKIHNPANNETVMPEGSNYQNVPSLDQVTSLIIGLSLIHKLVDDTQVMQPIPGIAGFVIRDEAAAIVDNLLDFASSHNWQIIDVNGWMVPNGGGDMCLAAAPLLQAGERITGNSAFSHYNTTFTRRTERFTSGGFEPVQHCITGYGVNNGLQGQTNACSDVVSGLPLQQIVYNQLLAGANPGTFNNQQSSYYQGWEASGNLTGDVNSTLPHWDVQMANFFPAVYQDWEDDHKFDFLPWPFDQIKFDKINLSDYNNTIYFNLGVVSGLWNSAEVNQWADITENRQLELINSLLYDLTPTEEKEFYQGYLNSMDMLGPFKIQGSNWQGTETIEAHEFPSNGWASEYRWTHPIESFSAEGRPGIFNGLDYMFFHNLYYLLFEDDLPAFEKVYNNCFCATEIQSDCPPNIPTIDCQSQEAIDAFENLNKKLTYLPYCDRNVFESQFNSVNGYFPIEPKFSEYSDYDISTVRYQTSNAELNPGADVEVFSDLVICSNKTLTIHPTAQLETVKGDVYIKTASMIDVYGDLRIGSDTRLKIGEIAKVVLHSGARLFIEDNAQFIIDAGGALEFYNGAEVITSGNSEFIVRGIVKMMDGGVFTLDHSASAESGRVIIEGVSPGFIKDNGLTASCEVILSGKDADDEYVRIKENSRI